MALVPVDELVKAASPFAASNFYNYANYVPNVNQASMPAYPMVAALDPRNQLTQEVVRTKDDHLVTRTPEEVSLKASIDILRPQLTEKYRARIDKLYLSASTHVKGKNKGKPRKISARNILKISLMARALLARQQKIEARSMERADMAGVHSLVGHVGGKRRGWKQRAFGRAERARQKAVRASLLKGEGLEGDAAAGAQAIAQGVIKRYKSKIQKEKGVGADLLEATSAQVRENVSVTATSGQAAGSNNVMRRASPSQVARANAAMAAAAAAAASSSSSMQQ